MATKKQTAPEIQVTSGPMLDLTKVIIETHTQIAVLETEETAKKKELTDLAKTLREDKETNGEYIGLIRIIDQDKSPIRVEFRLSNGALNVSEEDNLNKLFGIHRPALFEKVKVVTDITDPDQLVQKLKDAGLNPWDYLSVGVKEGMDTIVSQHPGCVSKEAILPKKTLLTSLNDFRQALSDAAKVYVKEYLQTALRPFVVCGTKGSA